MRSTFMLRSSRPKPRPLERLVRTMSPSRTSTRLPRSRSSRSTMSAMVVLPAPDRPVNHSVKPRPCLLSYLLAPFSITILLIERLLNVIELILPAEERCPYRIGSSGCLDRPHPQDFSLSPCSGLLDQNRRGRIPN